MIARAGSSLWLLKHEIKMFMITSVLGAGKKNTKRRRLNKVRVAVWLSVAALLHLGAFFIVRAFDVAGAAPPMPMVMLVTGVMVVLTTWMLSTGLRASVEALFERGDLDLLLSSPLATRSIFTVRLAGIVVSIAGLYLFFLTPLAHAGLVLGRLRWLAIYPTIIGMAAITASLSMLLTLGLVRALGVRRTRVIAQVLGALSGAMLFILSQLFSNAAGAIKDHAASWLTSIGAPGGLIGPDSPLWMAGRAALGDPLPLLALSLAAAALFIFTVRFTHGFFVHGVQQAVSAKSAARRPAGEVRYRFGRSLTRIVIVKEWRLILRDSNLISQVLLQLLYMLPMFFVLFAKDGASVAGIAAGLTLLCGSLTASLAWIIISAEDAPDLLLAAPCKAGTVRRAKLAAVAIPPLLLVSVPLLWTALHNPLGGLLCAATVTGSVVCSALVVLWCGRPAQRSAFKRRARGSFMAGAFEVLTVMAWAGTAFLLLNGALRPVPSTAMLIGGGATFAAALLVVGLAWIFRRSAG